MTQYRMPDGEKINRDECMYCFSNQYAPGGQYLCMFCDTCCCKDHAVLHYKKTGHKYFANLQYLFKEEYNTQEKIKKALETQSIDDIAEYTQIVTEIADGQIQPVVNQNEEQMISCALLFDCPANDYYTILKQSQTFASELACTGCPHVAMLSESAQKRDESMKCQNCDLEKNLWLCLTCGALACGRRQPDGSGGNGHALEHYEKTGHPLVLKITSCCKSLQEVYCYKCDNDATVPLETLEKVLSNWQLGFLLTRGTGSEASMAQQQLDAQMQAQNEQEVVNQPIDLDIIEKLVQKPLRNAGNTCYCNAVINCLLSNKLKLDIFKKHVDVCKRGVQRCIACQMARIAFHDPSRGTAHSVGILRSLNDYFTNPENCGKQQDAVDVFNSISAKLMLPEICNTLAYHCTACDATYGGDEVKKQRYLSIGLSFYIDKQEVDIQAAFHDNFSNEGQRCQKCQQNTQKIEKLIKYVDPFPPMICLQINRLRYDSLQGKVLKMATNIVNCRELQVEGHTYILNSFIIHLGQSYDCGHYIAICYSKTVNSWIMCNDATFCLLTEEQAFERSKQAYLLFYELQ